MGLQTQIKHQKRPTTNGEHGLPRYPNLLLHLCTGVLGERQCPGS